MLTSPASTKCQHSNAASANQPAFMTPRTQLTPMTPENRFSLGFLGGPPCGVGKGPAEELRLGNY